MKIDADLKALIQGGFALLDHEAAARSFPPRDSLANALKKANPSGTTNVVPAGKVIAIAKMFTTAAVDAWLRAIHSFLVSASLTKVSPIWASVSGYYSSHYTVRSIAHLLGYFQLFKQHKTVHLEIDGGHFTCTFGSKAKYDHEHYFYWKVVKDNPLFAGDAFFTLNKGDDSDVAHRNKANYADHLSQFPVFQPPNADEVRIRIERISEIEFKAPPIPLADRYPDVQSVQIIAYHRIVRFRDLVDAVVTNNRFWKVHRDPPWAREFMDFQLTEEPSLRAEFTL